MRSTIPLFTLCALTLAAVPALGNLMITPTFDRSITSDPNSATIESTINSAISSYEADFVNPINVNIRFKEGSVAFDQNNGLGESDFDLYEESYASFLARLTASAATVDDAAALASLYADGATTNPVTGSADVLLKSANAEALGYTGDVNNAPFSFSDGTVTFNSHLTTPGSLDTSGNYLLLPLIEHEIDEILGLGSTLGTETSAPLSNEPSPEDFFRYHSDGTRSYSTTTPGDATQYSYFSIDGSTDLAQFDNTGKGDYGDWQSNPLPSGVAAQVQDAFASPGLNPTLGLELRALDVIGYTPAPEPASFLLAACGLGTLIAMKRRRRASVASSTRLTFSTPQ